MTTRDVTPKCPGCGKKGTIYGRPYGLQIGSHIPREGDDVDAQVILVLCGECGVVVGAYQRYTVPDLSPRPRREEA